MEELRALLIEWDTSTGKRAGNINPRDKYLRCNGWQNMDVTPAIELRIVDDDRDLSIYNNTQGVEILIGNDAINSIIDEKFIQKVFIEDEIIYSAHMQKIADTIDFNELPDDVNERLSFLKIKYGIKGLKIKKHNKV